jgi:hypothetical protein
LYKLFYKDYQCKTACIEESTQRKLKKLMQSAREPLSNNNIKLGVGWGKQLQQEKQHPFPPHPTKRKEKGE